MTTNILDAAALRRALSLRDLTDPACGAHAMQHLLDAIALALEREWRCRVLVWRACPVVDSRDNYDHLDYPPDGAARDARYTRYVAERTVLRTQTSAMIPPLLRALSAGPIDDVLVVCPGLVYRRDQIDRHHVGEPHQVDLWRLRRRALDERDLARMVEVVVRAALPGQRYRTTPAAHPYTEAGRQIDVEHEDWIEIGECGLASSRVLERAGLLGVSGLAMGLGLDRLLMLRKGIDDIRLLRADDPRVAEQMLDLSPYRAVSSMPPIKRDLSIVVARDRTLEELGDRAREALGERAGDVESIAIAAETPYEALPEAARARLGMGPSQKNVLLRVVLRHPTRSMTHEEANVLRDVVYAAVHEGPRAEWAARAG
ncbi:MAG: hypothetical protein KF729_04650 [Sandaracinaceae bacterium]|nr:hypothetical protein [Sandaracinaceae bacterium]